MTPSVKPRKKVDHHLTMADYIRKHSPIKKGLRIPDEDKPVAKYNKIMSKLYLGNFQSAKDKIFFKDSKIKAVLNCSKDIPNSFAIHKDIEYMRIPVDDSLKSVDFEKMYNFLPAAVEFIHKHVDLQKQNLLVHCWAGRQRSAACVAGYLIAYHDMTPHEACRYISERRIEAFHFQKSLNFDQALEAFYKDLKKCNLYKKRKGSLA
jgi:protein-tyrosine phosphatase